MLSSESKHIDSKLEKIWIYFILIVTCPFNPLPFDQTLLTKVRSSLELGKANAAIKALDTQWNPCDSFVSMKIDILIYFAKHSEARALAM